MELLNIYERKNEEIIEKDFEEKRAEIKSKDKYEVARRQCADIINEIYKAENNGEDYYKNHKKIFSWAEGKLITEETKTKLEELRVKQNTALEELYSRIEEINANLSICETYEQKIAVLKTYKILDKDGKML